MALSIPEGKTVYTTRYTDFKGVDYLSTDECVDVARFSDCDNLMFDKAGLIEKRLGFRCLEQLHGKVHSMKQVNINGKSELLIHSGNFLYKYDGVNFTPLQEEGYKRYSFVIDVPSGGIHENKGEYVKRELRVKFFKNSSYQDTSKIKNLFAVNIGDRIDSSERTNRENKGKVIFGGTEITKEWLDSVPIDKLEQLFKDIRKQDSSYCQRFPENYYNLVKNGDFSGGVNDWHTYGKADYKIRGNGITCYYSGANYHFYQALETDNINQQQIYITFLYCGETENISAGFESYYWYTSADAVGGIGYQVKSSDVLGIDNTSGVYAEVADVKSSITVCNDEAFITTTDGIFCYEGMGSVTNVENIAYAPVTVALRNMNYTEARFNNGEINQEVTKTDVVPGSILEAVNLLTRRRINTFALSNFCANVATGNEDYTPFSVITLDSTIKSVERIEVLAGNGKFVSVDNQFYSYTPGGNTIKIMAYIPFTTVYPNGIEYSNEWCPKPYVLDGVTENLKVYFTATEPEGYEKKIDKCYNTTTFGVGKDDRLFLTGNDKYPNYIWYSEFANFSYIPDINYIVTGEGNAKNLGFTKVNQNLLVHKEGNGQDATVFMVSGSLDSSGKAIFTVVQGINGVGAISERGFTNFDDVPLFLSDKGIYSVESTNVISEKTVVNRSGYINPELLKHDLKDASMVSYDDMVLCSAGGYIYVLYPRKQSYLGKDTVYNAASFEALRWSIPDTKATVFSEFAGGLYFGTEDARILKLNNDVGDLSKYNDTITPEGEALPVKCYFVTKLDDDGSFMTLKTMIKRGCGIMLKPYAQSSVRIFTLTEKEHENQVKDIGFTGAAIMDFDEFWFDIVDFSTRSSGRIIPFNTKIKKYSALSFRVQNDKLSQGFGVIGIEKRYTLGNYKKY